MAIAGIRVLYRHAGVALLRAAGWASTRAPDEWPDPDDPQWCVVWLRKMWSEPDFAEAVRQASPSLAHRVDAIIADQATESKQIRRATVATAGYLLRALGRPTPFGVFAGVAPVSLGDAVKVRWGAQHRSVVRVDTEWLADVIDRFEAIPALLEGLDVVFTDLAVRRGGRLEAPCGVGRVHVRCTAAVEAARAATVVPVRFGALADGLADTFEAGRATVVGMLTGLVRHGFLITCLRAPSTVTDPLRHLLSKLAEVDSGRLPPAGSLLCDVQAVAEQVEQLNGTSDAAGQTMRRAVVTHRMQQISTAGRTRLAMDLLLDCEVELPEHAAEEMGRAATALLRLTRHPTGWPAWRDYHAAFCDRYGTGTLVPVNEVLDPDAGLGYPAGYPGSVQPGPVDRPTLRDQRLLELAWRAITEGRREIVLTDEIVTAVTGDEHLDPQWIPPHVELAARIHAASTEALQRGDYAMIVAPARAGGTLTSRFTPTTTGSGLEKVYQNLPAATDGGLLVQMSFPPAYPHAENVSRIPEFLPHLLPLAEHRTGGSQETRIRLDDLAVTAMSDRLHLVSMSRGQVIEPQVFHALALDKQPPPLARFLAHLPRAYAATWTVLDWGPSGERLPYLPSVRYGRCILAPARWRLTSAELPRPDSGQDVWKGALREWQRGLACPSSVELRDDDRCLQLELDEPLHAAILRTHLARRGQAILIEPMPAGAHGWMDGHAHEIALPLVRTGAAAPSPQVASCPVLSNRSHGQWPGQPGNRWWSVRIHAHPERHDEIIAHRLSELDALLGEQAGCWFIRYRNSRQTDHLRLRLPSPDSERCAAHMATIGDWVRRLRVDGLAQRLIYDTYNPEVGRYGDGPALDAAERVFIADSRAVSAQLRHLPTNLVHPIALATASMVHIVVALLGPEQAMRWLVRHPVRSTSTTPDRVLAAQAIRLAKPDEFADCATWPVEVAQAWQARATALATYRDQLPAEACTGLDSIVESLLHVHCNRALGIDPDVELVCRRLAHQAGRAWKARRHEEGDR